jgi:hypothetical protein
MNTLNEPTIEDIKKFADEKRKMKAAPKKTRQPRQKKQPKPEPKPEPEPEPELPIEEESEEEEEEVIIPVKAKKQIVKKVVEVVEEPDNYNDITKPFKGDLIGLWQYLAKKDEAEKEKNKNIYDGINSIKDLLSSQKQVIEEPKKPKAKPKSNTKPKGKKLDLVISDKELEAVLNPPDNNTNPVVDKKLQAFLEAFQKK